MNKGGIDGQVNKVIDQAAGVAKQKIGEMVGGKQQKETKPGGGAAGLGDMVSGAIGKAAAAHAADSAADQAMAFGKKLLK